MFYARTHNEAKTDCYFFFAYKKRLLNVSVTLTGLFPFILLLYSVKSWEIQVQHLESPFICLISHKVMREQASPAACQLSNYF